MYPQLRIDLAKINNNLDTVVSIAKQGGCSLMIVTKSFCADQRIVAEILKNDYVQFLADSRIQNIASYADQVHMAGKETVLLRLPMMSEIADVVRYADVSLNSGLDTIKLLDKEAAAQNKKHKVILMIDMGDLREGMFFKDEAAIMDVCGEILKMDHVVLEGIGVNLSCYGAIIPKPENLGGLCAIAEKIEKKFSIRLNIISGGNSSSIYLIPKGELPARINNVRLGESFILGNETAYSNRIEGTYNDAVTLRAQIIELKNKPSLPIGDVGVDAFGQVPVYEDRGNIDRAILAVGKQDTNPDGMTPLNTKADILGASSDHLIMDVTKEDYKLGDTVDFSLDYGALLKLFTSQYIDREYI
ncbi:MAG: alanine/ornithine racemase family PLP-dependent enzyme [Clostridia bacterium]|nr:alanine/ornithine racemase family PLP-dependent enzyme [Clostridia bacterium]